MNNWWGSLVNPNPNYTTVISDPQYGPSQGPASGNQYGAAGGLAQWSQQQAAQQQWGGLQQGQPQSLSGLQGYYTNPISHVKTNDGTLVFCKLTNYDKYACLGKFYED